MPTEFPALEKAGLRNLPDYSISNKKREMEILTR